MSARDLRNGASPVALSWSARLASSANAARFTNSSRRRAHCSIFRQACGVRSKRWKQSVSQIAQLSKSLAQRSICAGVTRAGSSTNAVSMRASYQPVFQSADRQLVVPAEALRQLPDLRHGHAEGLRRGDPVPRQPLASALRAASLEPGEHVADPIRCRGHCSVFEQLVEPGEARVHAVLHAGLDRRVARLLRRVAHRERDRRLPARLGEFDRVHGLRPLGAPPLRRDERSGGTTSRKMPPIVISSPSALRQT